ncbi:MAG: response regulator [Vulcanimicrobiota bacterium]
METEPDMNRIVLIEDEKMVRKYVERILRDEGYTVYCSENGRDGLQLALAHIPDFILCDISMPLMDGYNVLKEIRTSPLTAMIPFIFLTGRMDKHDMREGMDGGADDYLTKPFTREELLNSLKAQETKQARVAGKYQAKIDELGLYIAKSLPHELRTPLAGIMGASSILKDSIESLTPYDIKKMAQTIYSSSLRLNRLVDNYLQYAELQMAMTNPEKAAIHRKIRLVLYGEPVTSSETVLKDSATEMARQTGREKDLELLLQESPVNIPEGDLRKIVEELLNNAFKYSSPGTPVLLTTKTEENSFIISITDHGRGMNAEQISSIGAYRQFDRNFYEQQGAGLGLAITKHLAQLYDGELTIQSMPGKETTACVTLPA